MNKKIDFPQLKKGTYRHNKSGNLYQVIGVAIDTETQQTLVVYSPLYEHDFRFELFARPYQMFVEQVELEGRSVPRFEYVGA
jgi:hypothetical protein